jgi:hypothetical protein
MKPIKPPLWKRIGIWLLASFSVLFIIAVILYFCIDRRVRFQPEKIKELAGLKTLASVESYLGAPPGDYTTVPFSLDPPESAESPEKKTSRHRWMRSFGSDGKICKTWITDDGCILIAVTESGRVVACGATRVYLSREPSFLDNLKGRLGFRRNQDGLAPIFNELE